jgi:processive 1,2-diacylglycerol beta-glucosyltransferase
MGKRILILTAGFGEGHNAAARGMRDGLTAVDNGVTVEVHDIFAETYGVANDLARKGYLAMINRAPQSWSRLYQWLDRQEEYGPRLRWLFLAKGRLSQLLLRFQPTAVVMVYPAYPYLLEAIFETTPAPFQRVVCITDSITVNAIWYRCATDLFLVPNEQTAAQLANAQVPGAKVRVTGFPVSPRFAEPDCPRMPPELQEEWRVFYMINTGGRVAPGIIERLNSLPNLRLTVTIGRDERLRQVVERVNAEATRKFEIIGWTDELPRLMRETHILITKAGGATTQEAIAAECPMIISQVVPGQEEGNARLIEESNAGVVAMTPDSIVAAVERAIANNGQVWREWSRNISALSRPRASLEIAELLLTL